MYSHQVLKYLIVFLFLLIPLAVAITPSDSPYGLYDDSPQLTFNGTYEINVNNTDCWLGICSFGGLLHSDLDNLEWSVAGHLIDANIDMNSYQLTDMHSLILSGTGYLGDWDGTLNSANDFAPTGDLGLSLGLPSLRWANLSVGDVYADGDIEVAGTGSYFNQTLLITGDSPVSRDSNANLWLRAEVNYDACINLTESTVAGISICYDGTGAGIFEIRNYADGVLYMDIGSRDDGLISFYNDTYFTTINIETINSTDWSNVSITESQISDLLHNINGTNIDVLNINATDWSNASDAISLWTRAGTVLSPKTAGDDVTTTGIATVDKLIVDSVTEAISVQIKRPGASSDGYGSDNPYIKFTYGALDWGSIYMDTNFDYCFDALKSTGEGNGINFLVQGDIALAISSAGNFDFQAGNLITTGNIYNKADNSKHYFGLSDDSSIYYNASDMIINPREVGSGDGWLLNDWHITGDLDVQNNFTGNQIYGEMWNHTHTGQPLNFAVDGLYYNLTFNDSDVNGFEFDNGNDLLRVQVAGKYKAGYMASGDGENNNIYFTTILINGVEQDKCESHKKMTAGADIVTMTGSCFIDLVVDDYVQLGTADIGDTSVGNFYSSELNLIRISN